MCDNLDGDLDSFEASIGQLHDLGRTTYDFHIVDGEIDALDPNDPVYLARKDMCEKSRFVWLSTMQAVEYYCDSVLEQPGFTPEPRVQRIDRMFQAAVELLCSQSDRFYRNVCCRRDELAPLLRKHLAASTQAT